MEENETKYLLTLTDKKGLKRICALFANFVEIMKILNEDSKKSPDGEARVHYEVEIKIKEMWI